MVYDWQELGIYDRHCWCMGIDLLKHQLVDTGEKIQLPYSDFFSETFLVDLAVYKLVITEEDCKYAKFKVGDVLYIAKNYYVYPKYKVWNFLTIDAVSFSAGLNKKRKE